MIVTTTESLPGKHLVEIKGLVRGSTVRAAHAGEDLVSVLKNVLGGEVEEYTRLLAQAREQAIDRMTAVAEELGADAVVGVRFATAGIMAGAAEVLAYGTAVVIAEAQ